MRVVAIVQARMGSSRLPGKVLADLAGASMLARVVQRLRLARRVGHIVVATTSAIGDVAVLQEAERLDVSTHGGSEHDVLARYLGAARAARADAIVRVTADCPLLDPWVVDRVIEALGRDVDYASNTHERTYPRGLDVEAMHRDTLERMARLATSRPSREHVTSFIMEQPALFRVRQVRGAQDDSDLRWTVDTPEDLETARAIYATCSLERQVVPYERVVAAVRAKPELAASNTHVVQKSWRVANGG